jgi:hypothetical protein
MNGGDLLLEASAGELPEYIKIRIDNSAGVTDQMYRRWCREYLKVGSWKWMIPLIGNSITYLFKNPEDATAFRLRFEIRD